MIKYFISTLLFVLSLTSCMFFLPQVTLTGEKRPALAEDAVVTVYEIAAPDNYDQVGYMVLRGNSPSNRINEAKKIARSYGCNAIIAEEAQIRERQWQEPIYQTTYTTDPATGISTTNQRIVGYQTRHESWIEQMFIIIHIEENS
ncbi:MAG: hypothetical protein JW969_18315 [Spirochaetales bacterium]|nr:hypothetical protein [Spirochaetales bacterium]